MRTALPSTGPHHPALLPRTSLRRRAGAVLTAVLAGTVLAAGVTPASSAQAAEVSWTTTPVVTDGFARTATTGWGTAERGGTWTTTSGSTAHAVAPGAGRQRVLAAGQTGSANLGGFSATDVDVRVDVALDKMPTGGGTYVSVLGRKVGTSGDYRARLKVQSTGAVTLSAARGDTMLTSVVLPGVTYAPATAMTVRLQVTGTSPTTLRAKAWKVGTTEPSAWQVATTDATTALQKAGTLATATYVSASATNLPLTTSFSRLSVQSAGAPTKPGAANTGVPVGTSLRVHTGDLVVTTPGAVIDAMDIRGLVIIKAPDVTIKRSIIRGRVLTSDHSLISNDHGAYRFTVEDSELTAAGNPTPYISGIIGANFTVRRTNIHHVIDQIHITGDNVTVESSWLHDNLHFAVDPHHADGSHDDNVQVQGGRNIRLVGNTMSGSYNAALQITQDRSAVADLTYAKNWADNGGCTLNIAEKARGPMTGLVVADNTFGKTSRFGCTVIYPATSPISFARNLFTDGTAIKMVTR